MIPSFPVLTFPNHYTIVTGLYPEHHGIVGNTMRDAVDAGAIHAVVGDGEGRRAGGAASRSGSPRSARDAARGDDVLAGHRSGRSAACGRRTGSRTTRSSARSIASSRRSTWLALPAAERPSFVSLYFEEVDTAGHDFGPDSPELATAAAHLDEALGRLVEGVHRLGLDDRTSIVIVSDHGMTPTSYDRVIYLDAMIDLSTVDVLEYGSTLQINPRDGDVEGLYRRLHGKHPKLPIYKREDVPAAPALQRQPAHPGDRRRPGRRLERHRRASG